MTLDAKAREAAEIYPMPLDGWVCFHCGERFTTPGAASDHFGARPGNGLACKIKAGDERGLVMTLRKTQAERDEARREADELAQDLKLATDLAHGSDKLWDERGKQLAALREALGELESWGRVFVEKTPISAETLWRAFPKALDKARAALTDTEEAAAQYQRVPEDWGEFVSLVIHACREASRWRMKDGSECWCNRGQPSHSPGCKALAAAYEQAQQMLAAAQAGEPEGA